MYFLNSINIKKLKGMMFMSNANTQIRLKTAIWLEIFSFFSHLSYKHFPEASRAASASFFSMIQKLRLLVLWGNLVLTCNFFSDSSSSDHTGRMWRGFDTAQKVIRSYRYWLQVFSSLKLLNQPQVQTVIGQKVNCWNYLRAEWSCKNEKRLKVESKEKRGNL